MPTLKVDWPGIGMLAVGLGTLQYVLEEGNRDNWFQSAAITRLSIISGVALSALLIWELWPGNKHPVVNLRVLKNRDLAAALLMFLSLGFGLYGGIFIFPLFVQNILGFTATQTGLTMMPGGIATGISAIMCGRLLNGKKALVDPRILIVTGMALFTLSMWDLGHLTTLSGEADTQFSLIIRGFGLGMLFTPINLAAFNSLKGAEIAQGASMLNLMRQLGGSFGIAVLGTYLNNMTFMHSTELSANTYPGNPAFMQRMQAAQQGLMAHGYDALTAHQAALASIAGSIQRQALTMSYNDAFLLIGISVVLVSPAVFLLRSPKSLRHTAAGEMAH
jgi:DHA2 family multidrug resistance protein